MSNKDFKCNVAHESTLMSKEEARDFLNYYRFFDNPINCELFDSDVIDVYNNEYTETLTILNKSTQKMAIIDLRD